MSWSERLQACVMAWVGQISQIQLQQQQLQQQHQQQQHQHQQQQQQQPVAAYFHLLPLISAFADAVDRGVRDKHVDDLTNDLINRFEKCQEILNSISRTMNPKTLTLNGQKQKVEEFENQLSQRRELTNKYRQMVEKAVGSTP